MNKTFLFGTVAATCLASSVAIAAPQGFSRSAGSSSRASMSRPSINMNRSAMAPRTQRNWSAASRMATNRAAFSPRINSSGMSARMAANQSAFRSRLNTGATSARIAADRTSFQGRLNPRVAGNLTGNGSAFSRRVPDGTPVTDNGNVINPTAASTANNRNWAGNRNRSRNGNWSGNNGNWSGKDCG